MPGTSILPSAFRRTVSRGRFLRPRAGALLAAAVVLAAAAAAPGPMRADDEADLEISASDAPDPVVAGQQATFTVTVTNHGPEPVSDAVVTTTLPGGATLDSSSGCAEDPAGAPTCTLGATLDPRVFRVTEYEIPAATFTAATYDLTLAQDLADDYFVMVRGSSFDGGNNTRPFENYARLQADPNGTGDLAPSGAADRLTLSRGSGSGQTHDWAGVVTVVECLTSCTTDGFELRSVEAIVLPADDEATDGFDFSGTSWNDAAQVLLMGGIRGAGCETAETDYADHPVCHVRFAPSGSNIISWDRSSASADIDAVATLTVMAVEWGSAWNVQRVRLLDNNGTSAGNDGGMDAVGEYQTAPIDAVERANTWVWGTGYTDANGVGDSAEGVVVALGDGVAQNATESFVSAGLEHQVGVFDFEVWALEHPDLAVAHTFKADGDDTELTVNVGVASAHAGHRMAVATNSADQTNNDFPKSMFSARYFSDPQIRLERRRQPSPFTAWVQGVDFSGIVEPASTQVTFTVDVAPDAGSPISTTFSVDSALLEDPVPANDSHTEQTTVAGVSDLALSISDSVDPVLAGETVTYTLTVDNLGPSAADAVVTTSSLPAGTTLVASSGCAEDPNGVATCTLGTIAAGGDAVFTLEVAVDPDQDGATLQLDSSVASASSDPVAANDAASETTTVSGSADLALDAAADPRPAIAAGRLVLDVTITNDGPSDAQDTELTLALDPQVTLVDVVGCAADPTPPPTCAVGTLAPGGQTTVTVTVEVAEDAVGSLVFPLSVASSTADPDGSDDATTVVVRVGDERVLGQGETPAISADLAGDGDLAVVWNREVPGRGLGDGVLLRRLDSAGMPIGVELQLDTLPSGGTRSPQVVHLPSGEIVAIWEADGPDGDGSGIFGRRLDSAGMPIGVELQLNQLSAGDQTFPRLIDDGSGGFVATWNDEAVAGFRGQRFDSAGMPIGVELQFATGIATPRPADVVVSGTGTIVAAWENSAGHVVRQRFDSAGMPIGVELQLSAPGGGAASKPVLARAGAGLVAIWENQGGDGSGAGIFARRLDSAGMPIGVELQLNAFTDFDQSDPEAGGTIGGQASVVWQGEDEDGRGVFALRLDSAGMPIGVELRLNRSADGQQAQPATAPTPDGGFHVVWQADGEDVTAAPDQLLFVDGFESGDTSRW